MSRTHRIPSWLASAGAAVLMIAGGVALPSDAAKASAIVSTFNFNNVVMLNGAVMQGTIVYEYDSSTTKLLSIDSAFVSTTAGTRMPAFNWAFDYPQHATSTTFIGLQDDIPTGSHQFEIQTNTGVYNYGVFIPFTGIGASSQLITGNSAYNGFLYCNGLAGCDGTNYLTAGTSSAVLGNAVPTVPEPVSVGILSVGIVGMFAARRRRRA